MKNPVRLYIFVKSESPDPYVNVISIAVRQYRLGELHFVSIKETESTNTHELPERVSAAVRTRLRQLAAGKYVQAGDHVASIPENGAKEYQYCLAVLDDLDRYSTESIKSEDLDAALGRYVGSGDAIFDVTALDKKNLVDIVSLLLSRGGAKVCTFEIRNKRPEFNQNDLVHALREDQYQYRQLTQGIHVDLAKERIAARPSPIFLHNVVWESARKLWGGGHYREAVNAAALAVNKHAQDKIGRKDISESKLFQEVFSPNDPDIGKPRLRLWPNDGSPTYSSVQSGAISFSSGLYSAIRNPNSHVVQGELDEEIAFEQLAAFSLLARWLDQAAVDRKG